MNTGIHSTVPIVMLTLLMQSPAVVVQAAAGSGPGSTNNSATGQQQSHRRAPKKFRLENSEGAVMRLWKPDLSTTALTAEQGSITLPRTGVDNYHALVVEKDWGYLKESLIRYQYMHGKPSGHSTSELTAVEKTTFEIVPDPVPREHQHYRSNDSWNFLLRFRGAPAAQVPVALETSNGSRLNGVSDSNGLVTLRIPDDFSRLDAEERDPRTAEFSVSAGMADAGIIYQTRLSAEYRVDPGRWQSLGLGVFITGIGLVAGGVLGHRAGRSA